MNENALNVESEDENMIITGMAHFESVCKKKLVVGTTRMVLPYTGNAAN